VSSELRPWRNPRSAPHLPDVRPRRVPPWLRAWWPALVWAAVIFSLSTDTFSSEHTASFFEPVVRWFVPSITADQFDIVHHYIRKAAHFAEYFLFCLLLYRGVRGARTGWRWSWALSALFIAAGYSALDEVHQAFVTSRMASPYDSLLDSVGAFAATAALYVWFRSRPSRPSQPQPAPAADPAATS
jgi:VanZ family protein